MVDSLRAIIVDELEVAPGQTLLAPEILRFAADEAAARRRSLAVFAAEDDIADWASLGFTDMGYRVLAL